MQERATLDLPSGEPGSGVKVGYGFATAHHGEILQGVLAEPDGHLRRGLVSLMCAGLKSEATFVPAPNEVVSVTPGWKVKARRAAELTLECCNTSCRGGHLEIKSSIPPSWGFGSSTSDVTAAIYAVADALGVRIPKSIIANLAVKAEIASDSLMYGERAVLFAHREGVVIEDFGGSLPPLEVVGFNTDPTGGGVDTTSFIPASYSWWEIEAFRPLIGLMRQAISNQDPELVGRIASASARINQRHLPKPHFYRLEKLTEEVGGLGIQVAHSGTVVGLLFDPRDADLQSRIETARVLLAEIGINSVWRFRTSNEHLSAYRNDTLVML
jgi:uncharacterized protein involved in propanediol utilization